MADFDMNQALQLIGVKEATIFMQGERIKILQEHRCEPCREDCCQNGPAQDEPLPKAKAKK